MRIEKSLLYYPQPLANSYLRHYQRVESLFDYNPYVQDSFGQRLAHIQGHSPELRQQLCAALMKYNKALGAGDKTISNIETLSGNGMVVLTGQQPGMLTGPMYTIYKALGVCLLARRLSEQLKVPVVPIFWVGSEDHDYQEINHLHLPGPQGPVLMQLPENNPGRNSVGTIPMSPEINNVLQQVLEHSPGEFRESLGELFGDIATKSNTLSHWFASLMSLLFRDFGLVMADGLLPEFRQMQKPFIKKVLLQNLEIEKSFQMGFQQVEDLGYTPQVQQIPRRCHLFIYHNEQRVALYRSGSYFTDREATLSWSKEELLALVEERPESFSFNVVTKPLAQELMFPLLAYVAGPGEISYYALYKYLYHCFDRKMPIIFPRPSVTLVEPRAAKYLRKYNISAEEFMVDSTYCIQGYLKETQQVDVTEIFEQFKNNITAAHKNLSDQLMVVHGDVKGLAKENLYSILKKANWLERKVEQRHRKTQQDALRQLEWLQHMLLPNNSWQERVYNIIPYLSKYGLGIVNELGQLPLIDEMHHHIVYLE